MATGVALCLNLAAPAAGHASPDGAEWEVAAQPDGCLACHLGLDEQQPATAGLSIEGLPQGLVPGQRYLLTVVLEDTGIRNAGFLLSVLSSSGPSGSVQSVDDRTESNAAQARSTWEGSRVVAPGAARWQLVWTAPPAIDGEFRFDLWGNVGNDDLSPLGDSIRHRVWQLPPAP